MTVRVVGVLAKERTITPLQVEAGGNPLLATVIWENDRIPLELDEDVASTIALVYNEDGWNTNVRSPESGGGLRLIQYYAEQGEKLSRYAVLEISDEGDITLTDAKRRKHEFDFNADGSLLVEDETEDDSEEPEADEDD